MSMWTIVVVGAMLALAKRTSAHKLIPAPLHHRSDLAKFGLRSERRSSGSRDPRASAEGRPMRHASGSFHVIDVPGRQ